MSTQRISSFKSFSEVKSQQSSIKMHEENKAKREQLLTKIGQTLEEMGVTSLSELDEEKRTALVAKIFNEDRAEDIQAHKVEMGEPKKLDDEKGKDVQSTNESLVTEATRSQIGKIDKAGKITSVYVHNDGSPASRVPLLKNYSNIKTLNTLLDLGKYGISSLQKEIGNAAMDFNNPDRGITVFYGRDRNENDDSTMKSDVKSIAKYLKDAGNQSSAEYVYLFDERDGKWYMADVYDDKELKPAFESVEVNEDIDIHDKLSDLMNKLEVQIGNLLHAAKGNSDWTKELNAIKKAFETLEDRMTIASKKLGMLPESVEVEEIEQMNEAGTVWSKWGKSEPMGLSKAETKKVAELYAVAISKKDVVKCTVNQGSLSEDSFDLDIDGEKWAGGSYNIYDDGQVVNMAVKSGISYGKYNDSVDTIVKNLKSLKESVELNEGFEVHYSDGIRAMKKFGMQSQAMAFAKDLIKNKKGLQFVDVFNAGSNFHSTSDTDAIAAFWGDGSYTDNVSKKDPKLAAKKIEESVEVNEARSIAKIQNEWAKVTTEMKSSADAWKKAEGDSKASLLAKLKELTARKNALESELNDAISDKDKDLELFVREATKVPEGNKFSGALAKARKKGEDNFKVDGEVYKVEETIVTEADINSEDEFKEYAMTVLKKAFGDDFDEVKATEVADGILKKCGDDYGACVGMLTSSLGE